MKIVIFQLVFCFLGFSTEHKYPQSWWEEVKDQNVPDWEILPEEGIRNKTVILSKRNELGVFSNFALTPFFFQGSFYASVEGFWQMMKYPDPLLRSKDQRNRTIYPYTREQVKGLYGFKAKKAGSAANKINRSIGVDWITYKNFKFDYKDDSLGSLQHYRLVYAAIKAKVNQNKKVRALLIKTKGLELLPDHHQKIGVPKSYHYFDILMDIREQLLKN